MQIMLLLALLAWLCCLHIASRRAGDAGRRARIAMGSSLIAIALGYCAFLAVIFAESGALLFADKSADGVQSVATEGDPWLTLLAGSAALAFPALLIVVGWRQIRKSRPTQASRHAPPRSR